MADGLNTCLEAAEAAAASLRLDRAQRESHVTEAAIRLHASSAGKRPRDAKAYLFVGARRVLVQLLQQEKKQRLRDRVDYRSSGSPESPRRAPPESSFPRRGPLVRCPADRKRVLTYLRQSAAKARNWDMPEAQVILATIRSLERVVRGEVEPGAGDA